MNSNNTAITFRLPEKLKRKFDEKCEKNHINKTSLMRSWIEEFVKKR